MAYQQQTHFDPSLQQFITGGSSQEDFSFGGYH